MRFYERFLEGEEPAVADRPVAVQTNDGKWRAEQPWPPAASSGYTTPLNAGTYSDDGQGSPTGFDTEGVWTVSPPLSPTSISPAPARRWSTWPPNGGTRTSSSTSTTSTRRARAR
jgi:hypothetical protein